MDLNLPSCSKSDGFYEEEPNPFLNITIDDFEEEQMNQYDNTAAVHDETTDDTVEEQVCNVVHDSEEDDFIDVEAISGSEQDAAEEQIVHRLYDWNVGYVPVKISGREAVREGHWERRSRTYLFAAIYGEEDLTQVKEVDFGLFDTLCASCNARYWKAEIPIRGKVGEKCCRVGKLTLPNDCQFKTPPREISELYTASTEQAKNFQSQIMKYNKLFSTAFATGNFENVGNYERGQWALCINGEVRFNYHSHRRGLDHSRRPNHGQIYFLDYEHDTEENIIAERLQVLDFNVELRQDTLKLLETFLRRNNSYIRTFKFAAEIKKQEEENALREGRQMKDVVLVVNPKRMSERVTQVNSNYVHQLVAGGRYTVDPCPDFVGAVFTGDLPAVGYDAKYFPRDLQHGEYPPTPHHFHRTLDVQMIPLIHLHGEGAWVQYVDQALDKDPSLADHYKYRVAYRDTDFSVVHESKKLFMFYMINAAVRIEYDKLNYIRTHQKEIKGECYEALEEYVRSNARQQGKRVGKIMVLPKGIYGSIRHMKDVFYDALTASIELEHPSWFITLTCNRKWKEIDEESRRSRTETNFRPDLSNRSFEMRAHQLQSDIVRGQFFGKVAGEMYAREFQGRGLTHSHFLFIMEHQDKPSRGSDVDRFVWAHFPDPQKHPDLFDLVKKYMVHGPCDYDGAPCRRKDGTCKHGFPFPLREETDIFAKRPLYRRPRDGRGFVKNVNGQNVFVDNQWVVPYNPVLLLRYKAHLNVMYCGSNNAIKYLYSYLTKGSQGNKVRISIYQRNENNTDSQVYDHDEIQDFKEQRHMGPYEAHYKILGTPMSHCYPPVDCLPVHLPHQQWVLHEEGQEEEALQKDQTSQLEGWFELNKKEGPHRDMLYKDVVKNYRWINKKWKKSNRRTLGRLSPVALTSRTTELFYLRLLLTTRKNITSFEDLRTVNDQICPTFQAACKELHLTSDDTSLEDTLREVCLYERPRKCRVTFALILVNCHPLDPRKLWDMFKEDLCEDFVNEHYHQEVALNLALTHINEILEEEGATLNTFNLPAINPMFLTGVDVDVRGNDTSTPPTQEEGLAKINSLNDDQKKVVDFVRRALEVENAPKLLCVTGPGGTGKTTTYNAIIAWLSSMGHAVVACAFTGIAANLLTGGITSHRAFGLPLNNPGEETARSNLRLQSIYARNLMKAKAIIWDEISMIHAYQLEILDKLLRNIMNQPLTPFGGKILIVGGDFRQILPVVIGGTRADIVDATITSSELWNEFHHCRLKINIRAQQDPAYARYILRVGDGLENPPRCSEFKVPSDLLLKNLDELIEFTFGKNIDKPDIHQAAILCPTNAAVRKVNDIILDRFRKEQPPKTYYSATVLIREKDTDHAGDIQYQPEYLQSLQSSSIPPHELTLKQGMVCLLCRNMRVAGGLCNGTRVEILEMNNNFIRCKVLSGNHTGDIVPIFRITFYSDDFNLPGTLRRKQFPLKLAGAMTINRSQGQSLTRVGLYLDTPPFVHGQFYVGLSRVSNRDSVKIVVEDGMNQGRGASTRTGQQTVTQNVVYPEVLAALQHIDYI